MELTATLEKVFTLTGIYVFFALFIVFEVWRRKDDDFIYGIQFKKKKSTDELNSKDRLKDNVTDYSNHIKRRKNKKTIIQRWS